MSESASLNVAIRRKGKTVYMSPDFTSIYTVATNECNVPPEHIGERASLNVAIRGMEKEIFMSLTLHLDN